MGPLTWRLPGIAVAFAALAVVGGCGRKAAPMPPVIRVAERTHDLEAFQKEGTIHLQWSYPQMTSSGGPLPDLEGVAVWRMVIPISQEPPSTGARDRKVVIGLLEARGEVITEINGEALDFATWGAHLVAQDEVADIPDVDDETDEETVVWYAVRSRCCRNRWSDFSNIVRAIPDDPPSPPPGLSATADRDGIHLEWSAVDEVSVRIERSPDGETWETADTASTNTTTWTDADAAQGQCWSYRLRGMTEETGGDTIRIGPPGLPIQVENPDIYPPGPPEDLVCLPEGRQVRLRWQTATGARTYQVRRSAGGEPAEVIADGLPEPYHIDASPPAGNVTYIVRAIDDAGNVSEPTRCGTIVEEGS